MTTTAALLAIDVDAELAAVGSEQLHGPWQAPTELVRMALRLGAAAVDVRWTARGFRVAADPEGLEPAILPELAAALDRGAEAARRHRGLRRLEESGSEALLWAGSIEGAVCDVRLGRERLRRSGAGRVVVGRAGENAAGLEVEVAGRGWRRRRAEAWLRSAVRFSPRPVRLDGRDVRAGFGEGGWRITVDRPLPAAILVGADGDAPSIWLLQHGVASTRATVPGYPPFRAAVELGGVVPAPATPAALRSALGPALRDLSEAAVAAMLRVAAAGGEAEVTRLRPALVAAAAAGILRERIEAAALVRFEEPCGAALVSLADLAARAARSDRTIRVRDPGRRPDTGGTAPCAVLGTDDRAAVAELLGIRFRTAVGPADPRWRSGLGRFRARLVRWLERCPGIERRVPEADWSDGERALVTVLRAGSPAGGLELAGLHTGRLRRRRTAGGGVLLPRRNRVVRIAAERVAADPAWGPVAVRALLHGV